MTPVPALRGLAALAAGTTLAAALAVAPGAPPGRSSTAPSRAVILRAVPGGLEDAERAVLSAGGRIDRRLGIVNGLQARVPADRLARLERSPAVAAVTPDRPMRPLGFVSTLGYDTDDTGSLSAITRIVGAQDLWANGFTGKGVDVAVIDTGVTRVPGLDGAGKVVDGPDLSFDSQEANLLHKDAYGHGTHMAGIIAGSDALAGTNDGCATCLNGTKFSDTTKFVGVAPEARVVNVKAGAADGSTDVSQVIAAIDWVVQHRNSNGLNIKVLNLSFGTDAVQHYTLDPLSYAVEVAWQKGIVVVAAAGNDGTTVSELANPAHNPFVLAVGADDPVGTLDRADDVVPAFASRSTTKRNVDVIAPGVSVLGLRVPGSFVDNQFPGGVVGTRFMRGSGTSQSAAVTSGLVALFAQRFPTAHPDQIKDLLRTSAYRLPYGGDKPDQGRGLVDGVKGMKTKLPSYKPQAFVAGTGTGTLEGARGSMRVTDGGVVLQGEKDIFGKAWNAGLWSTEAFLGSSWYGGNWNGSRWSGDGWSGSRWSSATWTSPTWAGNTWTTDSDLIWDGSRWSGSRWSGSRWSGEEWTGSRWSGSRWSGSRWSGSRWSRI